MHPSSPLSAVAVKKEEKEARLKEFIAAHLAAADAAGRETSGQQLLVVARSCASPVVAALLSFEAELAARCIGVNVVLAIEAVAGQVTAGTLAQHWQVRCLGDTRFLEAHEQMVLAPGTTWIGDCMRREPSKRDAFECYAMACRVTTANAVKSHERLWQCARPVSPAADHIPSAGSLAVAASCAAAASLAEQSSDPGDGPSALTRQ